MNRPYFALNGHEIVDVVLADLKKAMLESGNFPIHKTFPVVSWNWTIDFDIYPSDQRKMRLERTGKESKDEPVGEVRKASLDGGREAIGEMVAPDQVRRDAGLKFSKPVTKPNVGTVDELVDSLEQTQKR